MNKLTHKQEKFVNVYTQTFNGTKSALQAYDTESYNTANQIAIENLQKPIIIEAIQAKITPEMVEKAHESLLSAVRLDYFVFPKSMSDEEIAEHVKAQGLTILNIRPSERGKLAFFSLPDGASRGKGIELYHKIHGTFAPEKKVTLNVEVSKQVDDAANILNEHYKRQLTSRRGNGETADSVGTETQD